MAENIHRVSKAVLRDILAGRVVQTSKYIDTAKEEAILHIRHCPECQRSIDLQEVVINPDFVKIGEGVELAGERKYRVVSLDVYLGMAEKTTAYNSYRMEQRNRKW